MHHKDSIQALPLTWRAEAERLRRYGGGPAAVALETCANELERALSALEEAPLTLRQAADESGYSTEHLGRLVREGKIHNAGRKGAPRIAGKDLPMKPGAVATVIPIRELDRKQIVRSAITKGVA